MSLRKPGRQTEAEFNERSSGRKQWSYTLESKQLECQLKARQSYEQQSGVASYRVGAAFWEVRAGKA